MMRGAQYKSIMVSTVRSQNHDIYQLQFSKIDNKKMGL